jgi:hypothetical protein
MSVAFRKGMAFLLLRSLSIKSFLMQADFVWNADSVASSGCLKLYCEELSALQWFPTKSVMSDK